MCAPCKDASHAQAPGWRHEFLDLIKTLILQAKDEQRVRGMQIMVKRQTRAAVAAATADSENAAKAAADAEVDPPPRPPAPALPDAGASGSSAAAHAPVAPVAAVERGEIQAAAGPAGACTHLSIAFTCMSLLLVFCWICIFYSNARLLIFPHVTMASLAYTQHLHMCTHCAASCCWTWTRTRHAILSSFAG